MSLSSATVKGEVDSIVFKPSTLDKLMGNAREVSANVSTIQNLNASKEHFTEVAAAYSALPSGVRKILELQGSTIVTTRSLFDSGSLPTAFHNRQGIYRDEKNETTIPEFAGEGMKKQGNVFPVVFHESAHAFDDALGRYSNSKQFQAAYAKDVAAMDSTSREWMKYFLSSDQLGRRETFAECIGVKVEDKPDYRKAFLKSFANTCSLVDAVIKYHADPTKYAGS